MLFSTRKMADHIPYGSTNKFPYSSIDWVDKDTLGMKTMGGKRFNFYNNFFVMTDIVLTCGKPQRFNLQPLDTFHTHAHEVHSDFFVLEESWDAYDEFQAHGHCSRKADFSNGRSSLFSEESK